MATIQELEEEMARPGRQDHLLLVFREGAAPLVFTHRPKEDSE